MRKLMFIVLLVVVMAALPLASAMAETIYLPTLITTGSSEIEAAAMPQTSDVYSPFGCTPGVDCDDVGDATLQREPNPVQIKAKTSELTPGNAYTMWGVIFNNPAGCEGPCDEGDIFEGGVPPTPNPEGRAAAEISVLWLDGAVAKVNGTAKFQQTLIENGDPPGAINFGPGLTSALGAEIHLIVRDHGVASDDPDELHEQLTTLNGGCPTPPGCTDVQFAVFLP